MHSSQISLGRILDEVQRQVQRGPTDTAVQVGLRDSLSVHAVTLLADRSALSIRQLSSTIPKENGGHFVLAAD